MGEYLSRFTYYDVVGYTLPGAIGLAALALASRIIDPTWKIASPSGIASWSILIIASYFAGHVLQSVSAMILPRRRARARIASKMSPKLIEMAGLILTPYQIVTYTPTDTDSEKRTKIIDAIDTFKLPSPDQWIYVGRQGFYRGSAAGFALWGILLFVTGFLNVPTEALNHIVPRLAFFFAGGTCLAISVLFYFRYIEFVQHEIEFGIACAVRPKP